MKAVTVAPLGPQSELDADTGRLRLRWGAASYGAGFEEAETFWYRAYVEACRRGLGTAAVQTVVLLGDAAEWIWRSGRAFLALPGVEVVEIIDLYHAYEYLWALGTAVFGPTRRPQRRGSSRSRRACTPRGRPRSKRPWRRWRSTWASRTRRRSPPTGWTRVRR